MKYVPGFSGRAVLSLALAVGSYLTIAHAQVQSGQVLIQAVHGTASYETASQALPLKENVILSSGTVLRTGTGATVDLILQYNGTALRLMPNSILSFDKLNKENAGEGVITETSLNLVAGSILGSQRKLAPPSHFEINTPSGVATIKGTVYEVRSDGGVTCISGSVQVSFTKNGRSTTVIIAAGYSFDPSSGKIVKTTTASLKSIIAHIDRVKENAETFKTAGATVVVRPEAKLSPTKGNNGVGNGQDPAPPGNPPPNDQPGTTPGNPGRRQHTNTLNSVRIPTL